MKYSRKQVDSLSTPCFVVNRAELRKNICGFQDALKTHWGNYILSYSVKTNPLPWLVAFAGNQGCYAEVVSDEEYDLALCTGHSESGIVFNGPIKSRGYLERALTSGALVNLESFREIDWIEEIAVSHAGINVGLRVNVDLEAYCPGETVTGEAGGRFGFSYETGHLKGVVERLKRLSTVQINGLHLHFTTISRSLGVYEVLASFAVKIAREYDLDLAYIDLGGGFYGGGANVAAYGDYARAIARTLAVHFKPEKTALIVEPGGALVCTPCDLIARVIDVNVTSKDRFVVTEASRLHLDHERKKTRYVTSLLANKTNSVSRQVVCGYTCLESDRLCVLENQVELSSGDVIIFHNAGAYSIGFIPTFFIKSIPTVYVQEDDGSFRLIRGPWNTKQWMLMSDCHA